MLFNGLLTAYLFLPSHFSFELVTTFSWVTSSSASAASAASAAAGAAGPFKLIDPPSNTSAAPPMLAFPPAVHLLSPALLISRPPPAVVLISLPLLISTVSVDDILVVPVVFTSRLPTVVINPFSPTTISKLVAMSACSLPSSALKFIFLPASKLISLSALKFKSFSLWMLILSSA